MGAFESESVEGGTQLKVPPQGTLFRAIEGNTELRDGTFEHSFDVVARWQFHVQVFAFVKFPIEEHAVEIKDFDIPVIAGGNGEYSM